MRLLALLLEVPTRGRRIHDANIVATMLVYGVRRLLTNNPDDFVPFAAFIDVLPLISPPSACATPKRLTCLLTGGSRAAAGPCSDTCPARQPASMKILDFFFRRIDFSRQVSRSSH